ncbi:chondroitin sulfate proteoglycan 4-like [Penaeus japonicus]|uniref:chondroitin sulfate proteoglycan 4-like n=1 Tax=Penaeus japonicus TaxID=27405 RepID=UPI001C711D58|nr:chondroitin sulfate proteoglycan 4-like [Penaeus japonicus]
MTSSGCDGQRCEVISTGEAQRSFVVLGSAVITDRLDFTYAIQVVYNGLEVFREVQEDPKSADVYAVEWECSDEFDAPADTAISFIKQGAYVAFQDSYPRTGGSIRMEVKTQKENALLMYNTGPPSRSDFIALEIHEGRPRLVLDKGNGAVGLNSTIYISDGVWHQLEAHFKPTYMELNVDDHIEDQPTHIGENKFFDLSGYLFVGGVEVNKQARAVKQGARNGDKSLEGCIQNLFVGERRLSIRESRVTLGIKADCSWAYPCLKNPCVDGARCVQEGTDGFKCECDLALCVRQNFTTAYKVFTKTTLPFNLEILSLTPMEVHEGGQALVTSEHLHLVLDYEKYGVRESGVHFHVITPPSRGRFDVDLPRRPEDTIFTLLDLNDDRVTYIHDGSETTEDSVVLELEFVTRSGYILPSYLQPRSHEGEKGHGCETTHEHGGRLRGRVGVIGPRHFLQRPRPKGLASLILPPERAPQSPPFAHGTVIALGHE